MIMTPVLTPHCVTRRAMFTSEDSPRKISRLLESTGDVVAALLLDFVKEYHCNAAKEYEGNEPFLAA